MKKIFCLILLFSILVIACGKQHQGQLITKEELGNKWPFSIEKGYVYKTDANHLIFETEDGTKYAVNGMARNWLKSSKYNYKDIEEIWLIEDKEASSRKSLEDIFEIGEKNKINGN